MKNFAGSDDLTSLICGIDALCADECFKKEMRMFRPVGKIQCLASHFEDQVVVSATVAPENLHSSPSSW